MKSLLSLGRISGNQALTPRDLTPSPELPDDTLLADVRLRTRAQNALKGRWFQDCWGDTRCDRQNLIELARSR